MKLKDQVCNLKLARKLKELRIKQKSLWYWVNSSYSTGFEGNDMIWFCDGKWIITDRKPDIEFDMTGKVTEEEGLILDSFTPESYNEQKYNEYMDKIRPEKIKNIRVYSAFTVAELGEILKHYWSIHERFLVKPFDNKRWFVWWFEKPHFHYSTPRKKDEKHYEEANTEASARAKMLVYLLENKLIKETGR